jgi:hypothetical protein
MANMKKISFAAFAAFAAATLITAGCVSTVSGTHTAAVPLTKDSVEGRYERTVDQVYTASVAVVTHNGVIITEYIPHGTNAVRALQGKVNENNVWVRVEGVDPKITAVTVQARTKFGGSDLDLAHELEKEIALQLVR